MASLKTPTTTKTTTASSTTTSANGTSGKAVRLETPRQGAGKAGKSGLPGFSAGKQRVRANHGPKAVTGPKKEMKRRQLIQSLRALKDTCEDVISHFRLKLQSELLAVLQSLGTPDQALTGGNPTREWNSKTINAALKELEKLKVKPEKGRLKDLARIHSLLRTLSVEL